MRHNNASIFFESGLVALLVAATLVSATTYQVWIQFQYAQGHDGQVWPINAGLVGTPDETLSADDCEAFASPAAWVDRWSANQYYEFVAWALKGPCTPGTDSVRVTHGASAWSGLSQQGSSTLGLRGGDIISASPVVFSLPDDLDQTAGHGLGSSRIATLSEAGDIKIHSLTKTAGALDFQLEYQEDLFDAGAGGASAVVPMISPILYSPNAWEWEDENTALGDGPDAGGNWDTYVYAAAQRRANLGCNGNQPDWYVELKSYDVYESGQNNVPRYVGASAALQCRQLLQSTPTIIYSQVDNICLDEGIPSWAYQWKWRYENLEDLPIIDAPPWAPNLPAWPDATPWQPCPATEANSFLVLASKPSAGHLGNPTLDVFDINPLNLVNGQYPLVNQIQIDGESKAALVGVNGIWINDAGVLTQTTAVIVSEEDGDVELFWDMHTPNPSSVLWALSPNGANPRAAIRSSASFGGRYVFMPFAETNPAQGGTTGHLQVGWVDLAAGAIQNSIPTLVAFTSFGLSDSSTRITSSAVITQAAEVQSRVFYMALEDRQGGAASPFLGLFSISTDAIVAGNTNAASYVQFTPNPAPGTPWEAYSSLAYASDDSSGDNYIFAVNTILCAAANCGSAEGRLVSYHS